MHCLSPDRHPRGDKSGNGSAYQILDGRTQLYGCAICLSGGAIDAFSLIREVDPTLRFRDVLRVARAIDPSGGGGFA